MEDDQKSLTVTPPRLLSRAEFHDLTDVPPEVEWFANIDNAKTRRAYRIDLRDFMSFAGIRNPDEIRLVTRAHVIACARPSRSASSPGPGPPSAASSRRCHPCSSTSASRTP